MPIQIRLWWIDQITKKINKFNEVNMMSNRASSKKTIQKNSDQSLDINKVDKFFKKFEK